MGKRLLREIAFWFLMHRLAKRDAEYARNGFAS